SKFDQIAATLRDLIGRKIHVVSSCEEMSWPAYLHADLARQIDAEAQRAGVALVGTGVNPGFVMDFLPVVLSSLVTRVSSVKATRPHNTIERGGPVPLKLTIEGGTPGDTATVASLVNYARVLPTAKPGLRTMLDIPIGGAQGTVK